MAEEPLQGAPPEPRWPFPPTYLGRQNALIAIQATLKGVLLPLQEVSRAYGTLGGIAPPAMAEGRWTLPAGATLSVRAGGQILISVDEIARGVVPPPDPLLCLASALHDAERWAEACRVFSEVIDWAEAQAAEYPEMDPFDG